jgi:hypothetical protein
MEVESRLDRLHSRGTGYELLRGTPRSAALRCRAKRACRRRAWCYSALRASPLDALGAALWAFYDSASRSQGGCKLQSMIRALIATDVSTPPRAPLHSMSVVLAMPVHRAKRESELTGWGVKNRKFLSQPPGMDPRRPGTRVRIPACRTSV